MIVLITGASHTGKTLVSQKLLEKYNFPYLSIDHLKMGLIRSGNTKLTAMDDFELTEYLWPIVREMIKTAIENNQSLWRVKNKALFVRKIIGNYFTVLAFVKLYFFKASFPGIEILLCREMPQSLEFQFSVFIFIKSVTAPAGAEYGFLFGKSINLLQGQFGINNGSLGYSVIIKKYIFMGIFF